jgi:D-alanine-D-alanine ligase
VKRLRVLALVHEGFEPPAGATAEQARAADWRAEFDVVECLRGLGHEVQVLAVGGALDPIRTALAELRPDISFNLLESFDDVAHWDQNVVAYLELQKARYSGCNARGMMLGRDKELTKKLLTYHRVRVPDFAVVRRGRRFRRPGRLAFPLFVKSRGLDASTGISQASVVESDEKLAERVRFIHESLGTDALVERYIEGRELYVGVIGNRRLEALPIWELSFENMPEAARKIATERLKWSLSYQQKHGITSGPARDLPEGLEPHVQRLCKRVCNVLYLTGYARVDLRLTPAGEVYVIEANPNPQIARGEDFADAAAAAGIEYGPLLERILKLGLEWDPAAA